MLVAFSVCWYCWWKRSSLAESVSEAKHFHQSRNDSYLGTFLTDLTMIHAAIPDVTPDGLINFDKKRKEFEVLAQIKLLQGAANSYHLPSDLMFDRWFASLLVLDEKEAHNISCQIEVPPPNQLHLNQSYGETKKVGGHRKSDSITSNSSSGAGSQFFCDINNLSYRQVDSGFSRKIDFISLFFTVRETTH